MTAATTLSAFITLPLRGAAQARAPRRVGEHQREEADGAGHVQEVEHGSAPHEREGRPGATRARGAGAVVGGAGPQVDQPRDADDRKWDPDEHVHGQLLTVGADAQCAATPHTMPGPPRTAHKAEPAPR